MALHPRHTALLALAALALLLAPGCKPPGLPADAPKTKQKKTNVEVWTVVPRDLAEEIVLPGVLAPDLSVRLSAEVGGIVQEVHVRKGDEVKAGQLLVVIDKSDLVDMKAQAQAQVKALRARLKEVELGAREEQIKEAEVAVGAARSAVALARKIVDRRRKLVEEKVLPPEVLDQAQGQLDQAQAGYARAREILALVKKGAREETKEALRAQIDAAQTAVALTESRIRKTRVKSPIAGVVEMRFIDADEFAAPGMPLFEIVKKSPLNLTLGVPERIFTRLHEGDDVLVTFDTLRARVKAEISRLAFSADRMTQTFEVEIALPNPVRAMVRNETTAKDAEKRVLLRPGLIGEVRFLLRVHEAAVAIPAAALVMDGANLFVYVEEGGLAKARPVRIGLKQKGLLEILEGLKPGDRLIVAGQKYTHDGDEVTVVQEHTGALEQ